MCKKHEKEIHLKTQNTEKKLNKRRKNKKKLLCVQLNFHQKRLKDGKEE